jgi:SDR family mycofactocin-dependent oxidoreductase
VRNGGGVGGSVSRVALVTGAARGIGAATVRRLAGDGWSVVAVDRAADDPRLPYRLGSEAELRALAAGASDRIRGVIADVTDEAALAAAVELAEREFGGLDAALGVAGVVAGGSPLWEMPRAELDAVLDVDLGGVVTLARVAAVASAAATRGLPMLAAYCAAKAGVTGLVRALAVELGGTGVTANAVSPGSTDTPILAESARLYGLPGPAAFAGQQPVGRLLEPDEIADVLAWLSGEGSSALTGAVVAADGGLAL